MESEAKRMEAACSGTLGLPGYPAVPLHLCKVSLLQSDTWDSRAGETRNVNQERMEQKRQTIQ